VPGGRERGHSAAALCAPPAANSDPDELRARAEAAVENDAVVNLLEQKRQRVKEVGAVVVVVVVGSVDGLTGLAASRPCS
jgi:hypothetical protein